MKTTPVPFFRSLFKLTDPKAPGGDYVMRNPDAKYMWPFFRSMLGKLDELVPNIDPARRVLGGFSNGAHAAQGLIDESDGEVARRFSAFIRDPRAIVSACVKRDR